VPLTYVNQVRRIRLTEAIPRLHTSIILRLLLALYSVFQDSIVVLEGRPDLGYAVSAASLAFGALTPSWIGALHTLSEWQLTVESWSPYR
jgi:hypothetical protein